MLESLRRRILASWKTKLAPLVEWLILAEPQLRLTDDMDGDAIRREVTVYVKRCVRWQAKERQKLQAERRGGSGTTGRLWLRPVNRAFGAFAAGLIGLAIWWLLAQVLTIWAIDTNEWLKPSSATVTLLSLLIGSPVAFVIWRYRDQNTLWQIENQRKDINLKDFQKLAEWASGQHLQEDKLVEQTKRTEKATVSGSEVTTETVTTREGSQPPDHARSVNKRTGGESLQVAAVYQLQAFLDGEFGKHFQRPAFQLLKSLWEGLVREHVGKLDVLLADIEDASNARRSAFQEWQQALDTLTTSPLGLALNQLLAAGAGQQLHQHPHDVPRAILAGMNRWLTGLQSWALAGLELQGVHLQGSIQHKANLQGANLREANLQGTELHGAKLQWANLQDTKLQWAHLRGAELQGADMQKAKLLGASMQGANLQWANMQGAKLLGASLQGADLKWTNMRGSDLRETNLRKTKLLGTDLRGTFLGSTSQLTGAIYDQNTRFGRLNKDTVPWDGADWIDAKAEEQRWRDLGARRVGEEPT